MQKRSFRKYNIYYRPYNLPFDFASIAFTGDNWILPDSPIKFMHFHNCIEIGRCLSGEGTFYIEDKEYSFKAGNICIISENTVHISKSSPMQKSKWEYIYFDPYLLFKNTFPSSLSNKLFYYPLYFSKFINNDEHPYIHSLVGKMFSEFHKKQGNYKYALKGLFLAFIVAISRILSKDYVETDSNAHIPSALVYIHKHYQEQIKIEDIAKNVFLSEVHFRRKFLNVMHISPLTYINRLRIRKACQEMYHKEKAINEIASDVGFQSLSSFNRQFKSLLGCSPTEWIAKIKETEENYEIKSLKDDPTKEIFKL